MRVAFRTDSRAVPLIYLVLSSHLSNQNAAINLI